MIIYTITHVSTISHGLEREEQWQEKKLYSVPDFKFLVLSGDENNKMSWGWKLIFLAIAPLQSMISVRIWRMKVAFLQAKESIGKCDVFYIGMSYSLYTAVKVKQQRENNVWREL